MKDRELSESIGKRVIALRKRHRISQTELARRVGIRQAPMSNIEQGKSVPSTPVLIGLARALDTTIDDLVGGDAAVRPDLPPDVLNLCGERAADEIVTSAFPASAAILPPLAFDIALASAENAACHLRSSLGCRHVAGLDVAQHLCWEGIPVVEREQPGRCDAYIDRTFSHAVIALQPRLEPEDRNYWASYGLARILIAQRDHYLNERLDGQKTSKERLAQAIALAFVVPQELLSRYCARHPIAQGDDNEKLVARMAAFFGIRPHLLEKRLSQGS